MAARPALAVLAAGLLVLSGCAGGSVQKALGLQKRAPDEFAVVSRAPLIVPPDFELRPPKPGEARAAGGTAGDQARATLTGRSPVQTANRSLIEVEPLGPSSSAGQRSLLAKVGADAVDPAIRSRIAEENQALARVEQETFTRMMKWRQPVALGATVDAPAEAKRLLDNRIAQLPATAGDTPTVLERRQSPLGALVEKVF